MTRPACNAVPNGPALLREGDELVVGDGEGQRSAYDSGQVHLRKDHKFSVYSYSIGRQFHVNRHQLRCQCSEMK